MLGLALCYSFVLVHWKCFLYVIELSKLTFTYLPGTPRGQFFMALALRAALTIFGITFKRKKDNKINNSYHKKINNNLCVIYNE